MYNESIKVLLNNSSKVINLSTFSVITANFGIIIIVLGVIFNTMTLLIFRLDKELKKMPSIVILSFVCVTDTLSLFTWNLDHFLIKYDFSIENVNIVTCKIFIFMQYASLEISGLLLSLCLIDRYFTVASKPGSLFSKLPFGTFKTSLIWSISIISFICLLNSYLLFADRMFVGKKKKLDCYILANGFKVYDIWDKIHIFIYCFFPFLIMTVFNIFLIRKTRLSRKINNITNKISAKINNESNQLNKKNLTHTLLIISIAFLIMTLPSTIAYGFLAEKYKNNETIMNIFYLLDYLASFNHSILFFHCFFSNKKFRMCVFNIFNCYKFQM